MPEAPAPDPERVTLRHIAARANVHVATVSKALHHHPKLAAATRERICKIAEEMGYVPDPQLAVLTAYRHGKRGHGRETLALIHPPNPAHPEEVSNPKGSPWTRKLMDYAKTQGFDIDSFDAGDPQLSPERLDQILQSRGIRGLIVSARTFDPFELELSWERYAAVAFGLTLRKPNIVALTDTPFNNTRIAINALRARGYASIGLVRDRAGEVRVSEQCLGAYLAAAQVAAPAEQPPPFLFDNFDGSTFRRWFDRHRPDALLLGPERHLDAVRRTGLDIPSDCAAALLNVVSARRGKIAGIDLRLENAIHKTVDVVAAALQRRDYGPPTERLYYLIEGVWVDGVTCPDRSAVPA